MIELPTDTDNLCHPLELLFGTELLVHQPTDVHPVVGAGEASLCPAQLLPQKPIAAAVEVDPIPSTAGQLVTSDSVL